MVPKFEQRKVSNHQSMPKSCAIKYVKSGLFPNNSVLNGLQHFKVGSPIFHATISFLKFDWSLLTSEWSIAATVPQLGPLTKNYVLNKLLDPTTGHEIGIAALNTIAGGTGGGGMLLILSRVYKEKWDALGGINGFLAGQVCVFSRLFVCLCYIVCLCAIVGGGGATLKKSIPTLKFPKST